MLTCVFLWDKFRTGLIGFSYYPGVGLYELFWQIFSLDCISPSMTGWEIPSSPLCTGTSCLLQTKMHTWYANIFPCSIAEKGLDPLTWRFFSPSLPAKIEFKELWMLYNFYLVRNINLSLFRVFTNALLKYKTLVQKS